MLAVRITRNAGVLPAPFAVGVVIEYSILFISFSEFFQY